MSTTSCPSLGLICAQVPDVVGLSLQDGGSAVLPLALGELLRRLGYRGHITVGGPFATLARTWLLGRYAWLDSVVRFAGEAPLLALVRALARSESVANVTGLSTRAGDGPPADVLYEPCGDSSGLVHVLTWLHQAPSFRSRDATKTVKTGSTSWDRLRPPLWLARQ